MGPKLDSFHFLTALTFGATPDFANIPIQPFVKPAFVPDGLLPGCPCERSRFAADAIACPKEATSEIRDWSEERRLIILERTLA